MRRRDKGYSLRIGRLIELLALFLYAELVIYAEKGKQAPHTRDKGRDNNWRSLVKTEGFKSIG